MTYLGALSHGAHAIVVHRLGSRIRWTLHLPGGVGESARACLTEALRPAPDPPVLDGQHPLI